jgi:dihydrofolate reductase
MAELTYTAIASLDGYVADRHGRFDWAAPDEEVHGYVNELERPVGTYLYGRRMYDVMAPWETMHTVPDPSAAVRDFTRLWQAADKVVYSTTLESVTTARTRLERAFDPDAVRLLKESADRDLSIGGPGLAGHAVRAGLVDEYRLFVVPFVVGGGTSWLPDDARVPLRLVDERRFAGGVVFLRHRPR